MRVSKIISSIFVLSLFVTLSCGTVAVNSSDEKQGVRLRVTSYDAKSVACILENNTKKSILIDLNRSSITYNDNTSNIVTEGQRFDQIGTSNIPPIRLPSGAQKVFSISPVDCVKYTKKRKQVIGYTLRDMNLKEGSTVIISMSTYIDDDKDKMETVLNAKFDVTKE